MKKFTISQKLTFILFIAISNLLAIAVVGIYSNLKTSEQIKKSENLTSLKMALEGIRINYNSMRGDLLLLFLLDTETQQKDVESTLEHYKEKLETLQKKNKDLIDASKKLSPTIKTISNLLVIRTKEFINFAENNRNSITNTTIEKDTLHDAIKNKLIYQFDPLYKNILEEKDKLVSEIKKDEVILKDEQSFTINLGLILICVIFLVTVGGFYVLIMRTKNEIITPINEVKENILSISNGELPNVEVSDEQNETNDMLRSLKELINELTNVKVFSTEVGKGNFNSNITLFKGKGEISDALLIMKDNLLKASKEDFKRNWISEGLTKTTRLLNLDYKNENEMYDSILSFIIKYINANQGSIFITNNENENNIFLTMEACYAYDRKKFIHKIIKPGEGILGQAFLEKNYVYLKEIPQNYLNIQSGLGDAPPRNLIVLPLIYNDVVQGVLEIASFNIFEEHEINFLNQLTEIIASEITTTKINIKTQELLTTSQQQTEEMRSQEEEMRQNMEELSATQEEMKRIVTTSQNNETFTYNILNAAQDNIFTLDKDYKIINFNQSFEKSMAASGHKIYKGFDFLSVFNGNYELGQKEKQIFNRALINGEKFECINEYQTPMGNIYISSKYTPIYDNYNKIIAVACFGKDISSEINLKSQNEELIKEIQSLKNL